MSQDNKKIILVLSGGMDSATLLYYLLDKNYEPEAVCFDYGQKHIKEAECAREICQINKVRFNLINLNSLGKNLKSSLTQENLEVPEGYYSQDNMKSTIVPHRNLLMLTIASAIGLSKNITTIAYAAHAGDHFIYPDCRPIFKDITEKILCVSSGEEIKIIAPFISIDKSDILRIGLNLGVPYEKTWSCYKGGAKPCLKCGTCVERLEAFKKCQTLDPLIPNQN